MTEPREQSPWGVAAVAAWSDAWVVDEPSRVSPLHRLWRERVNEVAAEAIGRLANLGQGFRDAGMLAALETRIMSMLGAPIVIRCDPTKDREIAARVRSMSGVGMIVDAYKRCGHVWRGISAPLGMRGKRCGLEQGHPGAHTIYGPSEEDAS